MWIETAVVHMYTYGQGLRPQLAPKTPLLNSKRSVAQLAGLSPSCDLGESLSFRLMLSVYEAH